MARTTLATQTKPTPYSVGQVLTATACDSANGNDILFTGQVLHLFFHNTSGGSARTLTIVSQPDVITGRTGDITVSMAVGERRYFCLNPAGWVTAGAKIQFDGHADIVVSAVME